MNIGGWNGIILLLQMMRSIHNMCFKKEYKCYKGKDSEDCCQKRVDEAVAHRTNLIILIIAIALMILALTIKTSDSSEFVGQVSFASTITSIILSVIAIWMSITGERSTNEIKTKVSEAVDKLLKTTGESDRLVSDLGNILSEQNESYRDIKNQMEFVLSEVRGVKTTVSSMNDFFMSSNSNKKEKITTDTFLIFENIINGIPSNAVRSELIKILLTLFSEMNKNKNKQIVEIYRHIEVSNNNKPIMYGIVVSLYHNGFFSDEKNYEKLEKFNATENDE